MLTLKHKDKELLKDAALKLASFLRHDLQDFVVGPATPIVARLRNQYLQEILLKLPKEAGRSQPYKKIIRNRINLLLSEKLYKAISVVADVDPV